MWAWKCEKGVYQRFLGKWGWSPRSELRSPMTGFQGHRVALDEDNDEDKEGGSAGPHDDGGNEADVEVGDDNMQDQGALADEDADTPMHGHDISPADAVGAAHGQPSTSRGISLSQSRSKGGHDSHAMQGPKVKKRTRETCPSASTHKRQARTDTGNEARGALTASQEARPPRKNSQGGRSGGQGGGRGGGGRGGVRKDSQRVRPQELRDSGDEGEGVDPRMPKDADEPVQRVAPIDTTCCFFLKYDNQGFATQDVYALRVDVMRIKRIPCGRILFNHRSLSENIVRGVENAIESSINTDSGAWDRPELVLAPVHRNDIVGGQGRRITADRILGKGPDRVRLVRCSTVSWKDLCPSYFKNFGDLTCREREVALLLLMKGKVVATNVKVFSPRVNTECLLDIMRKERYMVSMFNYILFRAEGRADDEWNDAFFMSYKDLEDRYGPNGLCAAKWEKERDKLHVNKVKMVPRRLRGVEEARQGRPNDITRYDNMAMMSRDMMAIVLHAEGGDLKKVTVKPLLHNDLTTVHVVEEKFGKCQGKHGGIEGDDSAVYSIWEREPGKLRSLCGLFVGEAEGMLLLGRAHAGLVRELLLTCNNVIACDESAKDIAYLTKFVDILVKDERFVCHVEKPRCKHRSNRDMFRKLGRKRLKVWEYLFRDAPQGRLDGNYIYRKAKVTGTLKHYHGALTSALRLLLLDARS
ncbi:hypothetical protein CBR_g20152 [Chara braunii]|uniref:Uncharacterized protein n=1 Tax=Chara braunii TaxID=69332 RepID=A0A388KZR8_CHABU|nr:hypothetical protein CBR_g20152 [Chara braunii]|eukprot:GBG75521.1 hypothetical protein CBR_g20152 [Chara braunii]